MSPPLCFQTLFIGDLLAPAGTVGLSKASPKVEMLIIFPVDSALYKIDGDAQAGFAMGVNLPSQQVGAE